MLRFRNGRFRIVQIADIQEAPVVSKDTLKLLGLALDRAQPDLAVFTGDQLYGILPFFRMGDPRRIVPRVLREITAPLRERGIPFAVTFGNHDAQCGVPNAEQAEIYFSLPGCLRPAYRCETDKGTFLLPVAREDGEEKLLLAAFDSNGQRPNGEYLPVSAEQLAWFSGETSKRRAAGCAAPVLVFQHIPFPEYYDVLERVPRGTKGAAEAFRTHKNEYYTLPEAIRAAGGFLGESPATPDRNSGEFDVLREAGVRGVFVGHDHNNSFEAELKGVRLFYTQGCGFHAYGPHLKRGVRVIDVPEADPAAFTSHTLTWETLTNDRLRDPLLEFGLTHIPTSMEQVKRIAAFGGAAAAAAGTAGLLACCRRTKRGTDR